MTAYQPNSLYFQPGTLPCNRRYISTARQSLAEAVACLQQQCCTTASKGVSESETPWFQYLQRPKHPSTLRPERGPPAAAFVLVLHQQAGIHPILPFYVEQTIARACLQPPGPFLPETEAVLQSLSFLASTVTQNEPGPQAPWRACSVRSRMRMVCRASLGRIVSIYAHQACWLSPAASVNESKVRC